MSFIATLFMKVITNKTVLIGVGIALLLISFYGIYKYQSYNLEKYSQVIENQTAVISTLEYRLAEANRLTEKLSKNNDTIIRIIQDTSDRLGQLNIKNNEVKKQISEVKREISDTRLRKLTEAKPGLIELKVNKATESIFKTLEEESK